MKNQFVNLVTRVILIGIIFPHQNAFSQATANNNNNAAADFLGGNLLSGKALDVGQSNPLAINFYTNGGAYVPGVGFLAAMHRMMIFDAAPGGLVNSGFIGMGNCNLFTPQSLLHQHLAGNTDLWHQFTNGNTGGGTSANEGFQIGINYDTQPFYDWNGPIPPYTIAELRQWHDGPIDFYSNDLTNPATLPQRMRITYGKGGDKVGGIATTDGVTKILISHMGTTGAVSGLQQFWPLTDAVAMLNIGENQIPGAGASYTPYIGGARNWMDVGTHYSFDTDDMYAGLKDNGENQKDAVISWGDDPSHDSQPANHLMFIFTATGGSSNSVTNDGLEVARMVAPSGDFGMMGIGGDPDIAIPYSNLYSAGVEPGNTLEVNSSDQNAISTIGGNSGLRFTDLNTTTTATVNPGKGILSINSSGDVIYVEAIGNYCSELPQRSLRANYEIPLNRFDYFFSGLCG